MSKRVEKNKQKHYGVILMILLQSIVFGFSLEVYVYSSLINYTIIMD